MFTKIRNFKYFGFEIFSEYGEDFQQKITNFSHILGILNKVFKPNLVRKFSRTKVYNALALPNLYMEAKFGPTEERTKNDWHQPRWNCSEEQPRTLFFFYQETNEEIYEELKEEPVDKNLRRYKPNWQRHVTILMFLRPWTIV